MPRSAVTVVSRSSYISTGTPTTRSERLAPRSRRGQPWRPARHRAVERQRQADDDHLGLLVARRARRSRRGRARDDRRRWTMVSGEAIVPVRSLTATPMRFEPEVDARARTPGGSPLAASDAAARAPSGDAQRLVDGRTGPCRRPWRCRPCRRRRRRRPWPRP